MQRRAGWLVTGVLLAAVGIAGCTQSSTTPQAANEQFGQVSPTSTPDPGATEPATTRKRGTTTTSGSDGSPGTSPATTRRRSTTTATTASNGSTSSDAPPTVTAGPTTTRSSGGSGNTAAAKAELKRRLESDSTITSVVNVDCLVDELERLGLLDGTSIERNDPRFAEAIKKCLK